MTDTRIKDKIAAYFEASLSRKEEDDLFRQLLSLEGRDPTIDEALAVMLASRLRTCKTSRKQKKLFKQIVGIAASIAVIFGIGFLLIRQPGEAETFAYVAGKKISDRNEIKNIMNIQLHDIGESADLFSETLTADLDDIREAMTFDDI